MKVLMTCGGTGGHIYPAVAIANKIKEHHPECEVLFIGTKKGMENRLVPAAGYEIKGIDASGIDRKHLLHNFKTAADYIKGGHEANEILKEFAPDVVIGTGGYVTGSVIKHAHSLHIPCYIHEQNAFPGVANKALESSCEKVFISFPEAAHYFKDQSKIVLSGNPIRSEFIDHPPIPHEGKNVLVCGGSLGAEMINKGALEMINRKPDHNIIFVTGRRYYEDVKNEIGEIPSNVRLIDYENDMPNRMAESDLVISRSGAITLSEILASGKPAIFIPSPNVTGNHQFHNAKSAADAGAAELIEEKYMVDNIGLLADTVDSLINDDEKLSAMSKAARSIARLDAADIIYSCIYE